MKTPEVIVKGKDNGEGMVIHYRTERGTDVFGLGIPNIYTNADWDLGPTWCYLIAGQKVTLIDTGRIGNFEIFTSLLKSAGRAISDIDRIIVTHSHEDHDGNVAEIVSAANAELWAHTIYRSMISYHSHIIDGAPHPELPGSCRLCNMPESFYYENCVQYHKARSSLKVNFAIEDGQTLPDESLSFLFTPGHSPDAVCTVLEDEVIFTGDTLLPDITSHPSLARDFKVNQRILPAEYQLTNTVYGLMNYIRSLSKVARLDSQTLKATFPAHRLFYNGKFNLLDSSQRANEVIQFHIDRCRDILRIVDGKSAGIGDIVIQHFPPALLAGMGKAMARNEIIAHLEIMQECGDVHRTGADKKLVQSTGSENYLDAMGSYLR